MAHHSPLQRQRQVYDAPERHSRALLYANQVRRRRGLHASGRVDVQQCHAAEADVCGPVDHDGAEGADLGGRLDRLDAGQALQAASQGRGQEARVDDGGEPRIAVADGVGHESKHAAAWGTRRTRRWCGKGLPIPLQRIGHDGHAMPSDIQSQRRPQRRYCLERT